MMSQYFSIKNEYPDAILLFRMGDFYETFFDDAVVASRVLGIALTSRSREGEKKIPLAGVPHHAVDTYIARLVRAGHKVAICEQVENPKEAKGLVKRKVVEVVTPGTVTSSLLLDEKENNYLVAIMSEDNRWGLARADLSTGEFAVSEVSSHDLFEELAKAVPSEILFPRDSLSDEVVARIKQVVPGAALTDLDDWLFMNESAHSILCDHFKAKSLEGFGCQNMPLATGAAGTPITFTEPISGPGSGTMHTLDAVMSVAPQVDDTNGATQGNVLAGRTAWGLTGGGWGAMTGAMPDNGVVTIVPTTTNQTIAAGYHNGSGYVTGDVDLAAGNIRSGASIFGVAGDPNVVNTASGDAAAGDILSGRVAWVDGVELTGERYGGCTCSGTMNGTRWCDNGNGTVTDLTTCLVWVQDASWGGLKPWRDPSGYDDAHTRATSYGDWYGDWRLPTGPELYDLTHGAEAVRSSTPRAFTGVQATRYWSSASFEDGPSFAWYVDLSDGFVHSDDKDDANFVWPVRRGQ